MATPKVMSLVLATHPNLPNFHLYAHFPGVAIGSDTSHRIVSVYITAQKLVQIEIYQLEVGV